MGCLALTSLVFGCHPSPPTVTPRLSSPEVREVSRVDAATDATPTDVTPTDATPEPTPDVPSPFFTDNAPLTPGCIAWSSRRSAAACVIESPTDDLTNLRVVLRFTSDAPRAVVPIVDDAAFEAEREQRPSAPAIAAARARLAREGYTPIESVRRGLAVNEVAPLGNGVTARWQRRTTARAGANQAPRYTDRVTFRWDASATPLVVEALEDRPVEEPQIAVYAIEGGRFFVLEYVGRFADEGEYGTHGRAWQCDREARACVAQ